MVTMRFRNALNVDVSAVVLADADANVLVAAQPWREFRWRAGQKHYSGTYWSATEGRHVIREVSQAPSDVASVILEGRLPAYAGNLDIMTSAAKATAERIATHARQTAGAPK